MAWKPVAAGVRSDCDKLINQFVASDSIRYEEFAKIWREMKMSFIFYGRDDERELCELVEEMFKISKNMWLSDSDVQVRMGGFYLLYAFYMKQPSATKVKMPRLLQGDPGFFVQCFRMTPMQFEMLCTRLSPRLQKFPRNREAISPRERISVALSFLASGACIRNIALLFRVGIATASKCIKVVCTAIYEELRHEYLPAPDKQMWARSEAGFRNQWQFPGCIGALDGKHILLQCPAKSGSMFHNYKGDFSLVLMAVVDSSYRFLYVDIGAYGSQSDGGVFKASSLGTRLYNDTLDLPSFHLDATKQSPTCLVADSAFQLHKHFMKPYPTRGLTNSRRIFNYRLSRARRCVENAFGILAARWRVFLRPLGQSPETVMSIVSAAVILHNMLRSASEYAPVGYGDTIDASGNIVEGEWRSDIQHASSALEQLQVTCRVHQSTEEAKEVRKMYTSYFVSPAGEVPWQWNMPGVDKNAARAETT